MIGATVCLLLSSWASFTFFKGAVTGAPPLYTRGWFQRVLRFTAGLIFLAFAIGAGLKIVGKW
jgi:hypothetical protein